MQPSSLPGGLIVLKAMSSRESATGSIGMYPFLTGGRTLHDRVEQAESLDEGKLSVNQLCADIPAISDIRDDDAVGQLAGLATRIADAVGHRGRHHGPSIHSG